MFTDPEVAQVGLTEQQAAAHAGVRVAYLPASEADRAVTAGRTEGFVKIIAGKRRVLGTAGGGRVLGARCLCPDHARPPHREDSRRAHPGRRPGLERPNRGLAA